MIVVGAGHSGLEIAARLKYLGISHLVIDKKARIGDSVSWYCRVHMFSWIYGALVEGSLQSIVLARYGLVQSDSIFTVRREVAAGSFHPHFFLGSQSPGLCSVQPQRYDLNNYLVFIDIIRVAC